MRNSKINYDPKTSMSAVTMTFANGSSIVGDQPLTSRQAPSSMNVITTEQLREVAALDLADYGRLRTQSLPAGTTSAQLVQGNLLYVPATIDGCSSATSPSGSDGLYSPSKNWWWDDLVGPLKGCFGPFWKMFNVKDTVAVAAQIQKLKNKQAAERSTDDWEIPFESITDLQWLGSGSQGAVFLGKYNGTDVAVKKVKDVNETNIKHLRKLSHVNIIKFK